MDIIKVHDKRLQTLKLLRLREQQMSLCMIMTVHGPCAGSGKTRVAVEQAGQVLQRKPEAKVVFLATTVALALQQAGTVVKPSGPTSAFAMLAGVCCMFATTL